MAKFDASLIPLYCILGTAAAVTLGFGARTMTTHNDISLTRGGQMLWLKNHAPKLVDQKTAVSYYQEIHNGNYLRQN
ncbi:hypothetical protein DFA_10181 [Cavenderia fasciculata]|uniref:Uncharacterized protein n=1 Tax=Cavenderia fasciculata TaxID=261658 RepID=F4Q9H8_CACFS|nr:uncharacterized protein DFA_10181 [Cavenderia fasciculata]EGG15347.1 hypothetical protein DFA_10181 [Cavenderia fasciculata]|eukprot:XP_004354089.1 hypothetical protein DFA_10181 [Cavenderia fasciculata]